MPNFVDDLTDLAGPKEQWDGASNEGAEPAMFCSFSDYNAIRQALFDLRAAHLALLATVSGGGGGGGGVAWYDTLIDMTGSPISFGAAYDAWNVGALGQNTLIKLITDGTPSGSNSRAVRGLAGGSDGKIITFMNMATGALAGTANFQDGTGTAGSAFNKAASGGPKGCCTYYYDGPTAIWHLLGMTV